MPEGLNLGVPTRWWPLLRSGLLSPAESVRVPWDLVSPHLGTGAAFGDRSVGEIVGERLGRPVVERLVDPLIGGIHAGDADRLSAAATFPVLLAASHQPGSLMRRLGVAHVRGTRPDRAGGGPSPVFWSLDGTTASLVDHLAGALTARGVTCRTGTAVQAIEREGRTGAAPARWSLVLGTPGSEPGGAGTPRGRRRGPGRARPGGRRAAGPARPGGGRHAQHRRVRLGGGGHPGLPGGVCRDAACGAPGSSCPAPPPSDGRPALVTGCTYLSRKWPHLARPGDELIRASVGRFGDDRAAGLDDEQLTAAVLGELAPDPRRPGPSAGGRGDPLGRAFPQYEVGHLVRVARIEEDVAGLPGLAVAGAALRGVGIPACIGSGRAAARGSWRSWLAGPGPARGRRVAPVPGS